jgi:hypothetical protein
MFFADLSLVFNLAWFRFTLQCLSLWTLKSSTAIPLGGLRWQVCIFWEIRSHCTKKGYTGTLLFLSWHIYLFIINFLALLIFHLRVFHLLGRYFTTWTTPPATFAVGYFDIGSCFMPWPAWTSILLFLLPCLPGMIGTCHSTQPLVEMGSHELFARLAISASQIWLGLQGCTTMPGFSWHIYYLKKLCDDLHAKSPGIENRRTALHDMTVAALIYGVLNTHNQLSAMRSYNEYLLQTSFKTKYDRLH